MTQWRVKVVWKQFLIPTIAGLVMATSSLSPALAEPTQFDRTELSPSARHAFDRGLELLASGVDPKDIPGASTEVQSGIEATVAQTRGGASWSAFCSAKVSLLGMVVTETRVDGDFDTNGSSVTGIRNQRARVVRNYQPLTNVAFKEIRKEVSGGAGKIHALVHVERGPIHGGNSQTENWQTLAVNGAGKVTACKWGY